MVDTHAVVADHLQPGEPIEHRSVDLRMTVGVHPFDRLYVPCQGDAPRQQLDPTA